MIVVAIIGILAAIAIPAYQDYTIRAQVTEGLNLAGAVKAAVAEIFYDTAAFPGRRPDDAAPTGLGSPPLTASTSTVIILAAGVIKATYSSAGGLQANAKLASTARCWASRPTVSANGDVVWLCGGYGRRR